MWPAHGTLWSHLVSDRSLAELHTMAARAGLPARSFERDHYDVPRSRYRDLLALGAAPVSAHDLVRRLRASHLRISAHQARAHHARLLERWQQLAPPHPDANPGHPDANPGHPDASPGHPDANRAHPDATPGHADWHRIGADLLARWQERGRIYHGTAHLSEVLDTVADLGRAVGLGPAQLRVTALAAWFHDAVHHAGRSGQHTPRVLPPHSGAQPSDEEASAALADRLLTEDPDRAAVVNLVLMTAHHRPPPGDLTAAVLSDADLAILARPRPEYETYAAAIRMEYLDIPDKQFHTGRADILQRLLAGPLFYTEPAIHRWQAAARANLRAELAALQDRPAPTDHPAMTKEQQR